MSQDLDRLPPQIKYIVGNEACERLSFYGVRSILTLYIVSLLTRSGEQPGDGEKATAKAIHHYFVFATYFLPLFGAWLADRYWGRYKTIFWLSLAYCVGHGLLAVGEGTFGGLFAGLAFIAIGSGGIKPCVSAFVGDQFHDNQKHQLTKAYNLFYWSINFGAFFAFSCIPFVRNKWGYTVAFAIPGIAMAIATLIFWSGRRSYVMHPPTRGTAELDPKIARQNRKILWAIAGVFVPVIFFWTLYDQQNTTWVQQGTSMVEASIPLYFVQYPLNGETMQTVNAVFILLFIPLFSYVIYPWMRRQPWNPSLLGRMAFGMFIIALAFAWAAWLQMRIDAGERVSILWQIGQYALLTFAEVLVSTTGLEFAFRKAPVTMKSTIMSFWLLAVAAGNFVTAGLSSLNSYTDAAGKMQVHLGATAELIGYIGIILVAVIAFIPIARRFDRQFPDQPLDAER